MSTRPSHTPWLHTYHAELISTAVDIQTERDTIHRTTPCYTRRRPWHGPTRHAHVRSLNNADSRGGPTGPHVGFVGPQCTRLSSHRIRHLDRLSRFARLINVRLINVSNTHRQTDHATRVAINHILYLYYTEHRTHAWVKKFSNPSGFLEKISAGWEFLTNIYTPIKYVHIYFKLPYFIQ